MRFFLLLVFGLFFCVPVFHAQEVPDDAPPAKKIIALEKVQLILLLKPVAPIMEDPASTTIRFHVDSILSGEYISPFVTLRKSEIPVTADDFSRQFIVCLGEKPPALFYQKTFISFPGLKIPMPTYHPVLSWIRLTDEADIKKKPDQE